MAQLHYQFIKQLDAKRGLGKKALSCLITEENRRKLSIHLRNKARKKLIAKASGQKDSSLNDLVRTCLKHISPVAEPLVLISQIDNSGISLLNPLFDGHPEIHCHPQSFLTGYPHENRWPLIELRENPQRWFETIFEEGSLEHMKKENAQGQKDDRQSHFVFLPHLQKQIFIHYLGSVQPIRQRDVFDAYMTSYFGAWLNYRNLGQSKKIVTAFAPWLLRREESTAAFFEVYPAGKMIAIVQEPASWFASVCAEEPRLADDIPRSLRIWQKSMRALQLNKQKFSERICLIKPTDLIANTEAVMHYLADFLGINYELTLVTPTFNSSSVAGPDSFTKSRIADSSDAGPVLDKNKLKIIDGLTNDVYRSALDDVVRF